MAFLDKVKSAASVAADAAGDAAKSTVLKGKIRDEKIKMDDDLAKLGKIYLELIRSSELEAGLDEKSIISSIEAHEEAIEGFKKEIEELKED